MGLATLLCLATIGLTLPFQSRRAQSTPASEDSQLTSWSGWQGVWLTSGGARAFIALQPWSRVIAFMTDTTPSPLATVNGEYSGCRTWIMMPREDKNSAILARKPTHIAARGEDHIIVDSTRDTDLGLTLSTEITLSDAPPHLQIIHRVVNLKTEPLSLALWSITSVKKQGVILLPLTNDQNPGQQTVTFYKSTDPASPAIHYSPAAILIDPLAQTKEEMKMGVSTTCGWLAQESSGTTLLSYVPFFSGTYPEGGANIAAYASQKPAPRDTWMELEHVTPLIRLAPGRMITLPEDLLLIPTPTTNSIATRVSAYQTEVNRMVHGLPAPQMLR